MWDVPKTHLLLHNNKSITNSLSLISSMRKRRARLLLDWQRRNKNELTCTNLRRNTSMLELTQIKCWVERKGWLNSLEVIWSCALLTLFLLDFIFSPWRQAHNCQRKKNWSDFKCIIMQRIQAKDKRISFLPYCLLVLLSSHLAHTHTLSHKKIHVSSFIIISDDDKFKV